MFTITTVMFMSSVPDPGSCLCQPTLKPYKIKIFQIEEYTIMTEDSYPKDGTRKT